MTWIAMFKNQIFSVFSEDEDEEGMDIAGVNLQVCCVVSGVHHVLPL